MEDQFFMDAIDGVMGETVWNIYYGTPEKKDFICECCSELIAFLLMKHLNKTDFICDYNGCYLRGAE